MLNIVKEINDLLNYCISLKISDIHLESVKDGLRIRIRRDGILVLYKKLTAIYRTELLARLKIMAKLDINSLLPQDGRFTYQKTDIRISTIPTYWAEKIVLRLLFFDIALLNIQALGLPMEIINSLTGYLNTSGIILVTGPTGSGKTTTLYSILKLLDCQKKNILTIEDPIEYQLDNINQIQINPRTGLTFASVLRAVLRLDPDIIFVGEIRDAETAAITFRAALTGHLVLATLHTRDTNETKTRLQDLGLEDFMINSTLNCVIAQRLYRLVCKHCQGDGCAACGNEGYRDRRGLFEYLAPKENIFYSFQKAREVILQKGLTTEKELLF